jgi:hypothetical protein
MPPLLPRLPHLVALAPWSSDKGAPLMPHVARVSQLRHLDASAIADLARLAEHLAPLPALESLAARHTGGEAGELARAGVRLPRLTRLAMLCDIVTESGVDASDIAAVPMTSLRHLETWWAVCENQDMTALVPAIAAALAPAPLAADF